MVNPWLKASLMAALRGVPWVGRAVEVVEAVAQRRHQLLVEQQLVGIESGLTALERRVVVAVEAAVAELMAALRQPQLASAELEAMMKQLQAINAQGYHVALFEGLFQHSGHSELLRRAPSHYGVVLNDDQPLPPGALPLFLDLDKTRLLAVPPVALTKVLETVPLQLPEAQMVAFEDVWALPLTVGLAEMARERARPINSLASWQQLARAKPQPPRREP